MYTFSFRIYYLYNLTFKFNMSFEIQKTNLKPNCNILEKQSIQRTHLENKQGAE